MTDTATLEPSDLQVTPRVGEKVGDFTAWIAEVSSFKDREKAEEFLNIVFMNCYR